MDAETIEVDPHLRYGAADINAKERRELSRRATGQPVLWDEARAKTPHPPNASTINHNVFTAGGGTRDDPARDEKKQMKPQCRSGQCRDAGLEAHSEVKPTRALLEVKTTRS